MSRPISVSKIINGRLDALLILRDWILPLQVAKLKDYFSDIDEEITELRKPKLQRKPKPQEDKHYCWYCGLHEMCLVYGSVSWMKCPCGATKCLNPTKLRARPEPHWEGRRA